MSIDSVVDRTVVPQTSGSVFAQTWRLARWYFYTGRRRLMGKVLLGLLAAGVVLTFLLLVVAYEAIKSNPPEAQRCLPPAAATQIASQGGVAPPAGCVDIPPQELALEQQQWQSALNTQRDGITFPGAIGRAGGYASFMGVLLLCILAGSVVGTEFGAGTLRLTLTRGVARGQVLAAQIIAVALFAIVAVLASELLIVWLSTTAGTLLTGHITGFALDGAFQMIKYSLAVTFWVFAFGLVALFMAILGRSTAAGIAVSLGYLVAETVVGGILRALGAGIAGNLGKILSAIPNWFLGSNLSAIANYAGLGPLPLGISTGGVPPDLTLARALLTALAYCVVLIGLSYLVLRTRDVTD